MASITDHIVEGLKYPFNDVKRLLCFGVLFAFLNIMYLVNSVISVNNFKIIANSPAEAFTLKVAQLPANDMYLLIAFAVISFIIMLFVMGYQYKIVKFAIDKKQELPSFNDIVNILINGVKYFIVAVVYNFIPMILLAIGIMMANNQSYGVIIILLSGLLFIIAFFLLVMALNNMIAHDSLVKAFDFGEITEKISNLGWLKYIGTMIFTILVFAIIMIAVGFILGLVSAVFAVAINDVLIVSAIMGIIEGLLVTSYGGMFYNRVLGSIYREASK